jgi:Uma2 family endonuclease
MTAWEYLMGPEELRRRELVYGVVREPPAPWFDHQSIVTHLTALLHVHVRDRDLGVVCVSPIDVVLDADNGLVVQPDVLFIAKERLGIVKRQVWGAPDLVVEVASAGTKRYDRETKVGWYRAYGSRECWLIDPLIRSMTVVSFEVDGTTRTFEEDDIVASRVLPDFKMTIRGVFAQQA